MRESHKFDPKPLLAYLAPVVGCPADPAAVDVGQFTHGQSNPTFTLRWAGGAVVVPEPRVKYASTSVQRWCFLNARRGAALRLVQF